MKISRMLKNLIHNFIFLAKTNIAARDAGYDVDNYKYEIKEKLNGLTKPNIKNVDETLDALINSNTSLCRFGDGEFELINSGRVSFQNADKQLSKHLEKVLSCENTNILIGLPAVIYQNKDNITAIDKDFWRLRGKTYRNLIAQKCNFLNTYYSAEVTLAYTLYIQYDLENYFKKWRFIWEGKNVTAICGTGLLDSLQYNIFDNAKSLTIISAPKKNAYAQYGQILKDIVKIPIENLVVIILGPTATVLAHDLSFKGYRALDIGHLPKSYDFYKQGKALKEPGEFFSPD